MQTLFKYQEDDFPEPSCFTLTLIILPISNAGTRKLSILKTTLLITRIKYKLYDFIISEVCSGLFIVILYNVTLLYVRKTSKLSQTLTAQVEIPWFQRVLKVIPQFVLDFQSVEQTH